MCKDYLQAGALYTYYIHNSINTNELYYLSFKKYKNDNPDIFGLDPEIQNMRWNHINKNRRKLVEEVKKVIKK